MKHLLQLYLNSYRGLSKQAWMLALIMLINRSGAMVVPFLSVYMTQSLHFSLKETGAVLSFFGLGAVSGSYLGGWLSDRIGHFRIQLSCLLLCVPVFCILPLFRSPEALSAGVFILSLVSETFRPANSLSIVSYSTPESLTKAFSLNRMAMNLGFSIGPALGGFLAAVSYHFLFYGNAITCGAAALVFFLYFRRRSGDDVPVKDEKEESNIQAAAPGRSPWKDFYFLIFSVLCCLYNICFFQLLNTLPLFYREVHHLNESDIGLILAYSGLVVFSLEMLIVHIADRRMSAGSAIVLGTLACGASYSMLLLPGKFLLLYTAMFLLCISEILAMPFMGTVTMRRASQGTQGAYMGMNALSFSLAHVLSPLIGTRVADSLGFTSLWAATGTVAILTTLGFWFVGRRI